MQLADRRYFIADCAGRDGHLCNLRSGTAIVPENWHQPRTGRQPKLENGMTIKYRYMQAGDAREGEMQPTDDMKGVHEVVRAVVQQIANETGETVVFSMLNLAGTVAIGSDHAEPQGVDNTGQRTVETVEISEDGGESWNRLHLPS